MNGKKHGQGKYTFQDGSVYEGTFRNNYMDGKGRMQYGTTGRVYDGNWFEGRMEGYGSYWWEDGSLYEGEYRNNVK